MKKKMCLVLVVTIVMAGLTACGGTKAKCTFCNEEKKCKSYESIMGNEIYYCEDCEETVNEIREETR